MKEGYFRLLPWEKSGRLYEALGCHALYAHLAGRAVSLLLPKTTNGPQPLPPGFLAEALRDTRYFETANLARIALYLPPLAGFIYLELWPWVAFLGVICLFHVYSILTERYKRALCQLHIADANLPEPAPPESPPYRPHWWFTPKKWETERLYNTLWFGWARERTVNYINKTRRQPGDEEPVKFITRPDRNELARFEAATRTGEVLHLLSGLANLPPAAAFFIAGFPIGGIYMLIIWWGDTTLAMVQRLHRIRIHPLLMKLEARRT